jgi:hypothetical protein
MFGLFKKPIETTEVVSDIIEDILKRLLEQIRGLLRPEQTSENTTRESMAFVYMIGIFGIQTSRLGRIEKRRFSMTLTKLWSAMLPWDGDQADIERTLFLQARLKEYRSMSGPIAIVQRYMDYLGINSSEHVTFLASMGVPMRAFNIVGDFIDRTRKNYNLSSKSRDARIPHEGRIA